MLKEDQKLLVQSNDKVRIDTYLSQLFAEKRNLIQLLIDDECVLVNNQVVNKHGFIIKQDDEIQILVTKFTKSKENQNDKLDLSNLNITFKVIYEDEYLMVVYKPKGVIVHPTKYNEQDTLYHQLLKYQKDTDLNALQDIRAGLIHRLDKDTSGLMLVAKNREVFNQLKSQLEQRVIQKFYYALVDHKFNDLNSFDINLPIAHNNVSTKMVINENGKASVTKVKVIQNFNKYALVECELLTGRTHQIRVHLSAIGHAIYDDPLYGKKIDDLGQYLSAHKIVFNHPITKRELKFDIGIEPYILTKMEEITNEK